MQRAEDRCGWPAGHVIGTRKIKKGHGVGPAAARRIAAPDRRAWARFENVVPIVTLMATQSTPPVATPKCSTPSTWQTSKSHGDYSGKVDDLFPQRRPVLELTGLRSARARGGDAYVRC